MCCKFFSNNFLNVKNKVKNTYSSIEIKYKTSVDHRPFYALKKKIHIFSFLIIKIIFLFTNFLQNIFTNFK